MIRRNTLAVLAAAAMMTSMAATASSFDVKVTDKDGSVLCRGLLYLKPGEENDFSTTTRTPYTSSIYQMANEKPVAKKSKYETGNTIQISLDSSTGDTDKITVRWASSVLESMSHIPFSEPSGPKVDLPNLSNRTIEDTMSLKKGEFVKLSATKQKSKDLDLTITRLD